MIILDFESYHEIMYSICYVVPSEQLDYELNKLKDLDGTLENYGKKLFEFNKRQIDINLKKNKNSK